MLSELHVKEKYYLHVSTWGDMTIQGSLNLRANSSLQPALLGLRLLEQCYLKGSGENRGNPQLMRFRVWCKNRLIIPRFITCIKS